MGWFAVYISMHFSVELRGNFALMEITGVPVRFLGTTMESGEVSEVKLSKAGVKLVALLGGGQDRLKKGIQELGGSWLCCAKFIWLPCEAEGNEGGSR